MIIIKKNNKVSGIVEFLLSLKYILPYTKVLYLDHSIFQSMIVMWNTKNAAWFFIVFLCNFMQFSFFLIFFYFEIGLFSIDSFITAFNENEYFYNIFLCILRFKNVKRCSSDSQSVVYNRQGSMKPWKKSVSKKIIFCVVLFSLETTYFHQMCL